MKKLAITLMAVGLVIVVWNGAEWLRGFQSMMPFGESAEAFDDQQQSYSDYKKGQKIAKLSIPKLDRSYEVFWSTDDAALKKGVGMYDSQWTVPPGYGGHTVLSGHRDTVFTKLGKLQANDELIMTYDGIDYQYEINETWITDKDDRSVIVEKKQPTLTLATCYPFQYIGDAPDRYIVQATLTGMSFKEGE